MPSVPRGTGGGPADVFTQLCEEIGCSPDDVVNIRLNSRELVAVVREPDGLAVLSFRHDDQGLRFHTRVTTLARSGSVARSKEPPLRAAGD